MRGGRGRRMDGGREESEGGRKDKEIGEGFHTLLSCNCVLKTYLWICLSVCCASVVSY